jgi:hypothetical protein
MAAFSPAIKITTAPDTDNPNHLEIFPATATE